MTHFDFDIGIIGGGAAGLTVTAGGAAQLGARTLLNEKEPRLGGDCLHYGCVPSKTLIKTVAVYHLIKTSERFGLPRVAPPPVDFRNVADRIRSFIATIQQHDSVERFCKLGAHVEFGQALFTDEHEVDRRMQTSLGHIFAAGDVTGAHQFTHAAGYEGGVVIGNAIFHLPRQADYTLLPF